MEQPEVVANEGQRMVVRGDRRVLCEEVAFLRVFDVSLEYQVALAAGQLEYLMHQ